MNNWRDNAACINVDQTIFFPIAGRPDFLEARAVCSGCPVRQECLDEAIEAERGIAATYRFGMFGGATPKERWKLDAEGPLRPGEKACAWCSGHFYPSRIMDVTCSRECGRARHAQQKRQMARRRAA